MNYKLLKLSKLAIVRPSCSLMVKVLEARLWMKWYGFVANGILIHPDNEKTFRDMMKDYIRNDMVFHMKMIIDSNILKNVLYLVSLDDENNLAGIPERTVFRVKL